MKLSTTFRRAHDILAADPVRIRYSCDAIQTAINEHGGHPGTALWWRAHFTPSEDSPETFWLQSTGMTPEEKAEWRLTGLAFAAAITKSEGI